MPLDSCLTCEENFNGYLGVTEAEEDQKPVQQVDGYAR